MAGLKKRFQPFFCLLWDASDPAIQVIQAPALGTGAGNLPLDLAASKLREGYLSTAKGDAILFLLMPKKSDVTQVSELFSKMSVPSPQRHFEFVPQPDEIKGSLRKFLKQFPHPQQNVFVIMRFTPTKPHKIIFKAIQEVLSKHGLNAIRADERDFHRQLFPNILTCLHGCGSAIAVFDQIEEDSFNPNVSLEVGYFMALDRPLLFLKDKKLKALHTDLVGHLYKQFNTYAIRKELPMIIETWLSQTKLI